MLHVAAGSRGWWRYSRQSKVQSDEHVEKDPVFYLWKNGNIWKDVLITPWVKEALSSKDQRTLALRLRFITPTKSVPQDA